MQLITYLQRFQGALFLDRSVDPSHLAFLLAAAGGQFTWPKYFPENLPENLPEKTSHQKVTLKKSNWISGRFSGRFPGRYFGHVN